MERIYLLIFTILYMMKLPVVSQEKNRNQLPASGIYRIDASTAKINHQTTEIVTDNRLTNNKGAALKVGIADAIDGERRELSDAMKERVKKQGRPTLEFTSYRQYGKQPNTLSVLISTDFSGDYTKEGIDKATWIDITSKIILSEGVDNTPSGPVNLSSFASKGPVYLAFRYTGEGGTTQRGWTIKDLVIKNKLKGVPEYPISTIGDAGWTWVKLNPSDSPQRWIVTNTELKFTGGNETYGSNLGWVISKPIDLNDISFAGESKAAEPDLVFKVKASKAGRYKITTMAATDEEGAALMKKAKLKHESLFMRVQVGNQRPTKRVVFVPWNIPRQVTGKFNLSGEDEEIKIWLPRGVRLDYVELEAYTPPVVPVAANNYKPKVLPPATHPRLWVTPESLPVIKSRLEAEESKEAWNRIKRFALASFEFKPDLTKELPYNYPLEQSAEMKAFYYLMTGDKKVGREAVDLTVKYLSHVEFGNILDVTNEIGRAIYTGALVYDWTYDLLKPDEKLSLRKNMMRLADDMEIGWPPFLQKITNGHGNEAQLNRNLLSMSIAIYDEDPLPYQYCAYTIFEELIPMRKFEYASPRHNQGIRYGAFRMGWELHNAWLLYRMTGKRVFDDNIIDVNKFWKYMRTPDGRMLNDGDAIGMDTTANGAYWKAPMTMLLASAYAKDPFLKNEFIKQGGLPYNPVLFLLVNDPALKPQSDISSLPLTIDFGSVLGSMVARTGWTMGNKSNDVIAEIKGGGYHFGGHQQSDAGSLQIYYRGFQMGDIGIYGFYGTPYDFGFNKRSAAHSMMLVNDPSEKFLHSESNDGGSRFNLVEPASPEEVKINPIFNNGKVISSDFGPSKQKPLFSYFAANLTKAYSSKISDYTRGFCFLNMNREDVPAVIILTDDMLVSNPEFKKYWQINSYNLPEKTNDGVILHSQIGDVVGKTHVQMLVPSPSELNTEILSERKAHSSLDMTFDIPAKGQTWPEAHGHKIIISPSKSDKRNRFLTVFQMTDGNTKPLQVRHEETDVCYIIYIADRVVSMSNSTNLIEKGFTLNITDKGKYQVVLTGMKAGSWNIQNRNNTKKFNVVVEEGKNTVFFEAENGEYIINPDMLHH